MQMDGFGSDSTRMITLLRKSSPDLQLLLFSATFNEAVKNFALRVAGAQANQASTVSARVRACMCMRAPGQATAACLSGL